MSKFNKYLKKSSILFLAICFILSSISINVFAANGALSIEGNTIESANIAADKSKLQIGEELQIDYTVNPMSIQAENGANRNKEIILVVDTSGSMQWQPGKYECPYYSYEKSRLKIMQEVGKKFIEKFAKEKNISIGIIEYNEYCKNDLNFTNVSNNNLNLFNQSIDKLIAGGSTNIGDGLRTAFYKLNNNNNSDKYIVFMTDGYPEAYSFEKDGDVDNYYMGDKSFGTASYYYDNYQYGENYNVFRSGEGAREGALIYAKKVAAELIAPSKIKTFVIGFSTNQGSKNEEFTKAASGTYYNGDDENSVSAIYANIGNIINSTIVGKAHFEEVIPDNLEVDINSLPTGFKVEGCKLIGDMNNISYELSADKKNYLSGQIKFGIKYKAKKEGPYTLSVNKDTFVKLDVLNNTGKAIFSPLHLSSRTDGEVKIEVSDVKSKIESYNSKVQTNQAVRYDKIFPSKKITGETYADMSFQGDSINFFQYQFIKDSVAPKELPTDSWIDLDGKYESYNNDVIVEKQGFLNWRGYDVNHMPNINNQSDWANPELVFKNPYSNTAYKSATISASKNEYGQWETTFPYETLVKNEGKKLVNKRWITNSVFLNKMEIDFDIYKEASKFWGYMRVDKDGWYTLRATSDDGCRVYLTVDGEQKKLIDMFYIHGSITENANEKIYLKKDVYYPINIEYSNWGGEAELRLEYYLHSNNTYSTWNEIPSTWFYPSKTVTPGEYASNVFKGSKGVKLPEENGNYYIAFRTGTKNKEKVVDISKSGIFGSFLVEPKLQLGLFRTVKEKIKNNEEFEMKYKLQPKELLAKELYKPNEKLPSSFTLSASNFKLEDSYPENMVPIVGKNKDLIINGQKINATLPTKGILYELYDPNNDFNTAVYRAKSVDFSVWVKVVGKEVDKYLLEGKKAIVSYIDTDGGNKQKNFTDLNITITGESTIINHGIFIKKSTMNIDDCIKEISSTKVVSGVPVNLGVMIEVKSVNPTIKFSTVGNYSSSKIKLDKYEVDPTTNKIIVDTLENTVLPDGKKEVTAQESFKLEVGKKYILVYNLTPVGERDSKINSTVSLEKASKTVQLIINDKPDVY